MTDLFRQALRETYKEIRGHLSSSFQSNASLQVCKRLKNLDEYRYAKKIALYQAVNGEVDLSSIWKSAPMQGKYCYFPALNEDHTLSFLPATPSSTFHTNRFGIQEPQRDGEQACSPSQLSILCIPLVAFDKNGTRLGMGAGYYDRTLANITSPLLVGIAYEFQCLPFIEAQPWDIPLHLVITERSIYRFNKHS